jgi:nicotinamidase-related amidase
MSNYAQPSHQHSALLVIDAQDSFKQTPRWEHRSNLDFETHVAQLIDAFRNAGQPVFFILHTDADEHFETTSPHFKLMSFLAPSPDEPVLVKNTRNSFTSTDLQKRLDDAGVRRLAITGIQTEQCCETTARLAADLGYDVDFVLDATMTFPISDPASGEELSTADILHRTAFVLRKRFARIIGTADLIAEVGADARRSAAATG